MLPFFMLFITTPQIKENTPARRPVLKRIILISYKSNDIKWFKNMYKSIMPIHEIPKEIISKILIKEIVFLSKFKTFIFPP